MRICHVITRLVRGGAQWAVLQVAGGMARRGHSVSVVHGPPDRDEGDLRPELAKLPVERLEIRSLVRDPAPVRDARAFAELCRRIRAGPIDVVHTWTSKAGILGRSAAAVAGVPRIVHSPQGSVFTPGGGVPGVDGYPLRRAAFLALERRCVRRQHLWVALSQREADEGVALGLARPHQVRVIPNAIDPRFFRVRPAARAVLRRELGIGDDETVFLCVGRLSREKGQDVLLDAFARFRAGGGRTRLWFAGDGAMRRELEERASRNGLSGRVAFLGVREDIPELLHASDALVLPSRYEAQGMALGEAMACGRPVVASSVGGVPEFIREGETGILVPPADPEALARALDRALDPDWRRRAGEAGRSRAVQFLPDPILEQWEACYRGP